MHKINRLKCCYDINYKEIPEIGMFFNFVLLFLLDSQVIILLFEFIEKKFTLKYDFLLNFVIIKYS